MGSEMCIRDSVVLTASGYAQLLTDAGLTGKIRERQLQYLAASTPVDPAEVRAWPLTHRIWLNAFAVVGPLL